MYKLIGTVKTGMFQMFQMLMFNMQPTAEIQLQDFNLVLQLDQQLLTHHKQLNMFVETLQQFNQMLMFNNYIVFQLLTVLYKLVLHQEMLP